MNLKEKQLSSEEQKIVLRTLAESVAVPCCKFLEVGSWLGDSTIILAKVAQKHGGLLFCIDWWKGNIGTDLMDIASKVDIFSVFWSRICKEGLQDIVIPIRSRSDIAATIIKENSFDLVFLDADHRYDAMLSDINQYAPLVNRKNGIFCGHDCEGRISDYKMSFLEEGQNIDYYETVHCGVVLAVGETFRDHSINYDIWSVQFSEDLHTWIPTDTKFKEIVNGRQTIPPPLGFSKNYFLIRYGKTVYAISRSNNLSDIKNEKDLMGLKIAMADSWQELEKEIGEPVILQLESYRGYNIVKYGKHFYALMGLLDTTVLLEDNTNIIMKKYQRDGSLFAANSSDEAKQIIDGFCSINEVPQNKTPVLIEEGYEGFNIVKFRENFYAIAQGLGPIDFSDINIEDLLQGYRDKFQCFVGRSILEAKHLLDRHIIEALRTEIEVTREVLQKDVSGRDNVMQGQEKD